MIAYEDLVTALQHWRARQGLSTGPSDFLGDPPPLTIGGLPVGEAQAAEQYTDLGEMNLVDADGLEVVEESTAVLDEGEILEEQPVADHGFEDYGDADAYAVGDQTDAAFGMPDEPAAEAYDPYAEAEPIAAADDDVLTTQPVPVVEEAGAYDEAPPAYDEAPPAYEEAPPAFEEAPVGFEEAPPTEAYAALDDAPAAPEYDAPAPVAGDFDDAPTAFSPDPVDSVEVGELGVAAAPSEYDDEATVIAGDVETADNAPPPVAVDEQTMDVDLEADVLSEADATDVPIDADDVLTSAPAEPAPEPPPLAPPPSFDEES